MAHHWPRELFSWHSTVLSLGQIVQLIVIILSLTALTLCLLAQDVFPMAHTLTIVEPIWHMFQNLSKTLLEMHSGYDKSDLYTNLCTPYGSTGELQLLSSNSKT